MTITTDLSIYIKGSSHDNSETEPNRTISLQINHFGQIYICIYGMDSESNKTYAECAIEAKDLYEAVHVLRMTQNARTST